MQKLVMVEWEIFNVSQTLAHKEDINLGPRSEVNRTGTPKQEFQVVMKARAQDSADMEVNGVPSCLRVVRSIIIQALAGGWEKRSHQANVNLGLMQDWKRFSYLNSIP